MGADKLQRATLKKKTHKHKYASFPIIPSTWKHGLWNCADFFFFLPADLLTCFVIDMEFMHKTESESESNQVQENF